MQKNIQTNLPQGVFDKRFSEHVFLEFNISENEPETYFLDALAKVNELQNENLLVTLAFGPELCAMLEDAPELPSYGEKTGLKDTQADLWVWLQGASRGHTFDAARQVTQLLADSVEQKLEVVGFVYHDMRDLTGFVDGIGNPEGELAIATATIPADEAGAGGSYLLTQKWVHKLTDFHQLSQAEQEDVIGHTKPDAQEFSEERMPATAHVGRVDIKHNGEPERLWRRSVPYGDTQKHGLYFVSFANDLERYVRMLNRMFGKTDDGLVDRLTDFSDLETGAWWYCPSEQQLACWLVEE